MKIKKLMVVSVVVMALLAQMTIVVFANEVLASQNNTEILVNGELFELEAYLVDDNNYFKLRDIAKVVSETEKQFMVTWDSENKRINLVSGQSYQGAVTEVSKSDGLSKKAIVNKSEIYKDGQLIQSLSAYTINNNNFFKLRDLAESFNIGIGYDSTTKVITVETNIDYTEPVVVEAPDNSNNTNTNTSSTALVDVETAMNISLKLPEGMTEKDMNFYANEDTAESVTFTVDMADSSYPLTAFSKEEFSSYMFSGYNNLNITSFDNDVKLNGNQALVCKFSFTSDLGNDITGATVYVTYSGAEYSATFLYPSDDNEGVLANNIQTCIDSITIKQ